MRNAPHRIDYSDDNSIEVSTSIGGGGANDPGGGASTARDQRDLNL